MGNGTSTLASASKCATIGHGSQRQTTVCVCVSVFVYVCVFAQRNEVVLTVREQKWSCSFSQQKQSSDMFCDTGYVSLLTRI